MGNINEQEEGNGGVTQMGPLIGALSRTVNTQEFSEAITLLP